MKESMPYKKIVIMVILTVLKNWTFLSILVSLLFVLVVVVFSLILLAMTGIDIINPIAIAILFVISFVCCLWGAFRDEFSPLLTAGVDKKTAYYMYITKPKQFSGIRARFNAYNKEKALLQKSRKDKIEYDKAIKEQNEIQKIYHRLLIQIGDEWNQMQ